MPIPPVATPSSATKQLEQYVITMKPGKADILPGLETPVLGYNGLFPGPTIKRHARAPVEVRQINQSGRELNVHLHGGVTEPQFDGHPHDAIPNGDGAAVQVPERRPLGDALVPRPRARRDAPRRCSPGWPAFYLLDDQNDKQLDLPQGDYDVPLMIQDRSFNADGSFRYRFDLDRGFRGDTILVNGAVAPRMKVERRLYRLRFLNAVQRARVQARARQRAQDGPDRLRRRAAAGQAGGAHVDPDGAGRARRRDRRLPPVRRRLEGDPAQHRRASRRRPR